MVGSNWEFFEFYHSRLAKDALLMGDLHDLKNYCGGYNTLPPSGSFATDNACLY